MTHHAKICVPVAIREAEARGEVKTVGATFGPVVKTHHHTAGRVDWALSLLETAVTAHISPEGTITCAADTLTGLLRHDTPDAQTSPVCSNRTHAS